mmetsp:Transcript_3994/g.5241  ORF Transcript_3994/g.5241 Transcript_3994/m.5241 type:complete len:121 (-) Transcript_3994:39-401(-)
MLTLGQLRYVLGLQFLHRSAFFFRKSQIDRGDGLFDGSVHAARTAKTIGLVDDVCEQHLLHTLRQRYGKGIRIKRFRVSPFYLRNYYYSTNLDVDSSSLACRRRADGDDPSSSYYSSLLL